MDLYGSQGKRLEVRTALSFLPPNTQLFVQDAARCVLGIALAFSSGNQFGRLLCCCRFQGECIHRLIGSGAVRGRQVAKAGSECLSKED